MIILELNMLSGSKKGLYFNLLTLEVTYDHI